MSFPREVSLINNKFSVSENITILDINVLNDKLYMHNVLSGNIISSVIYPLIFDDNDKPDLTYYRTPLFYNRLMLGETYYAELSLDMKINCVLGLRDLVFAKNNKIFDIDINLEAVVKTINENVIEYCVHGVTISPFPSSLNYIIHWLPVDQFDIGDLSEYFILNDQNYCMVFLNPQDLSFHNLENILNLDEFIKKNILIKHTKKSMEKIPDIDATKICLNKRFTDLLKINELNLYTEPINNNQRGGSRLIFRSDYLSSKINLIINNLGPNFRYLKNNFSHCNNIFRLNKFGPSDKKFISHYDTPYIDRDNDQYSIYTIIIYLTGSNNENHIALTIDDKPIMIKANDCIIFNQKYEHEGYPFPDTDKIFLRSELIYHKKDLIHDSQIAKLFNISCYSVRQSFFNEEIKIFVNQSFDLVNKARHINLDLDVKNVPYYYGKITSVNDEFIDFITNGHDYYFSEQDLKNIVVAILIDYIGSNYVNQSLNIQKTRVDFDSIDSLCVKFLKSCKDSEIYKNYHFTEKENDEIYYEDYQNRCTMHNNEKSDDLIAKLRNEIHQQIFSKKKQFAMIIFGKKIEFNIDDIVVTENKIYFKNSGLNSKIIFAACHCPSQQSIQKEIVSSDAICFNIPPIPYRKIYVNEIPYYHLTIDIFECGTTFKNKVVEPLIIATSLIIGHNRQNLKRVNFIPLDESKIKIHQNLSLDEKINANRFKMREICVLRYLMLIQNKYHDKILSLYNNFILIDNYLIQNVKSNCIIILFMEIERDFIADYIDAPSYATCHIDPRYFNAEISDQVFDNLMILFGVMNSYHNCNIHIANLFVEEFNAALSDVDAYQTISHYLEYLRHEKLTQKNYIKIMSIYSVLFVIYQLLCLAKNVPSTKQINMRKIILYTAFMQYVDKLCDMVMS